MPFRPSLAKPAVLIAALLACSSPTDVDPLAVTVRPLAFTTHEERLQWPRTPSVEGGQVVVVRGQAFVGCGGAAARARRLRDIVSVEITAADADRFCQANLDPWVPFEATLTGLAPGRYRVRVAAAGFDQVTEGAATVTAP